MLNSSNLRLPTLLTMLVFCVPAIAQDDPPTALAPEGPVNVSSPEFSWTAVAGADAYRVLVRNATNKPVFNRWYSADEAACGNLELECHVQTGQDFLAQSRRWKVLPRSTETGLGEWSQWLIFYPGSDDIPEAPPAPEPLLPADETETQLPLFSWQPVPDTSRYRLQVRDADNNIVLDRWRDAAPLGCSDGVSSCQYRSPKLFVSGDYRWKLLGKNKLSGKLSGWSQYQEFSLPSAQDLGSGLDSRPDNMSCEIPLAPEFASDVEAVRVYANVPVVKQVILVDSPTDTRWFSVGKDGLITSFDASNPSASSVSNYLDIRDRVLDDTGETGLLGMAFHPDYPQENRVFIFYTNMVNDEYVSYLSEFRSLNNGQTLSPGSERNIITLTGHDSHNHKAGTIRFGRDGYLYLSLGDGGTKREAQNTFSLFGSIIRIDVDNGVPYAIPPDNPFADGIDGAPEVFAYGLRNPWRWSFDPDTDLLWVTDVGRSNWEEVNIVAPGQNHGWPIMEGPDCHLPEVGCDMSGLTPPVHAYPHDSSGGFVVVGGFVYQGDAMPELQGTFIFADGGDRVWALFFDSQDQPQPVLLIDGGLSGDIIRSMYQDEDGELYLVKGGLIFQLVPDSDQNPVEFPQTLTDTGCVDPQNATVMSEAMIPYDVNTAFWTDGAEKSRWMALPNKKQIEVDEDGDFLLPIGTVLAKEFRLFDKRVETRLFVRHDDGNWAGYSYAWNPLETEATLVGPNGVELIVEGQAYTIPSRNECLACHSEAANRALGPEIRQLNGDFHYAETGRTANQLTTFQVIGLLDDPLPDDPENLDDLPSIDDASASFDERARAYVHANCSSCHRPGGSGRGPADLRFQPLEFMNICDVSPQAGDLGIEDARLLAPGEPERSIISVRMESLGPEAMPPIGKNRVDVDATAIVNEYIAGVGACLEAHGEVSWSELHPD